MGAKQPDRDVGPPLFLTHKEAARKLGISLTKFYGLKRDGEIRDLELGPGVLRVPLDECEAYLDRLKAAQWGTASPGAAA